MSNTIKLIKFFLYFLFKQLACSHIYETSHSEMDYDQKTSKCSCFTLLRKACLGSKNILTDSSHLFAGVIQMSETIYIRNNKYRTFLYSNTKTCYTLFRKGLEEIIPIHIGC